MAAICGMISQIMEPRVPLLRQSLGTRSMLYCLEGSITAMAAKFVHYWTYGTTAHCL